VATNEKVVDLLTKSLSRMKFEYLRENIDVVPLHREWWLQMLSKGSGCHDVML
jgi:hypothetical protein